MNVLFALLSTSAFAAPQYRYSHEDSKYSWYPNMGIGNYAKWKSENVLKEVRLGSRLVDYPKANCDNKEFQWVEIDKKNPIDYITYGSYLKFQNPSKDFCSTDEDVPCYSGSSDSLLSKMSSAVELMYKSFQPLADMVKEAIKTDINEYNQKHNVQCDHFMNRFQNFDLINKYQDKYVKDLKTEDIKEKIGLEKFYTLDTESFTNDIYSAFDTLARDAARKAFFEAGGVCLNPNKEKGERIDYDNCRILTHYYSQELTAGMGNVILCMLCIALAAAIIGVMIAGIVSLVKRCKGNNNNNDTTYA